MHDIRNVPEDEIEASQPSIKKAITTMREWLKPVGMGRFGLSFNWGSKEIFIGVSIAKILTETIVRRKDKRVLVRTSDVKIIDL
jgi:hypothetical protein